VVNKDNYLTLPWGWMIFYSWNSPFDFSFLSQSANADHIIQLFLCDPGTSPVASGELLGHHGTNKLETKGRFINHTG